MFSAGVIREHAGPNVDGEVAPVLGELPSVGRRLRRRVPVDALVLDEVARVLRLWMPSEGGGGTHHDETQIAGDVVWFEPGEKHWHGASPTTAMTHITIQEALDGKAVDCMDQVSDEQYQAKSSRNV
jgi:hypothetical protein